jgi:serine/threonine-protein kinase
VISNQLPLEPVHSWASLRPRELGHLLEGRRLDHFQLEEFIGGGGMGAVFRAHDTVLGRTVAVKVLAAGAAGNDETRQRFHNEAQSAARLDHPNIARVHYVGEDQGFNYIVFEFLHGKNLRDLVADVGPLPLPDALRFTLQIAEALAHAWQRDIVHRDIKPSNVLATPEGQVKLVDMGLARLRDVSASAEDLTASGMTLGTFDYISPEQARDPRHADSRSDIYSLGCTLYFMLCGRPPFPGGTAVQKLLMHQSDAPQSPRELRPDLPAGVEQLLSRMLAKSPDDRFQNPAELIAAVTTLADQLGIAVYPTTTVQLTVTDQGASWLSNALPWLAPAALLLICVFIIDYVDRSASSEPESIHWRGPRTVAPRESADQRPIGGVSQNSTADGSAFPASSRPLESSQVRPGATTAFEGENVAISSAPAAIEGEASDTTRSAPNGELAVRSWLKNASQRLAAWMRFEEIPLFDAFGSGIPPEVRSEAPPPTAHRFIVNARSETAFGTLEEAWNAAASGDVLEIHRSGEVNLNRVSLPLRLAGRDLTVRAGEGHWPILRVVTWANPRPGPRPSVITIEEGKLTLEGIELELTPEWSQGQLGGWGLFELGTSAAISLKGCRITLRGWNEEYEMRNHDDLFVAVGDTSTLPRVGPPKAPKPIRIELQDLVVRGGDSLVTVEGDAHVDLNVYNGLLILRGFLYDGTQRSDASLGASTIQLSHVTADLGEGLLKVKDISENTWVQANLQDNILWGRPDAALVEQDPGNGIRKVPLVWQGDRNIYQDWGWMFRQQASDGRGLLYDFSRWQESWAGDYAELHSSDQQVLRLEPNLRDPPYTREPADYVVAPGDLTFMPALERGHPLPGMNMDMLPKVMSGREPLPDAR